MRILFDYQAFLQQDYGGISRYAANLRSELMTLNNQVPVLLKYSNNHYIVDEHSINSKPFFPQTDFKGKYHLGLLINKLYALYNISQYKYDIFHPTYYDPYFLKKLAGKPFVITVHDMIHEIYPEYFISRDRTSEYKQILCKAASKIIAISHNTKRDLIRIFKIDASKIDVVHHGVKTLYNKRHSFDSHLQLPIPYLLYLGKRDHYKHYNFFIKSIAPLLMEKKEFCVVCVGGGAFSADERLLHRSLGIENRVIQISVSDMLLPQVYKQAHLFVFPSLYEGFGIPILEAFAAGCPVACSNASSFPEVAGDSTAFFDPTDSKSIYSCIKEVISEDSLRKTLIEKGRDRVKLFSLRNTALKTLNVYKHALGEHN